MEMTGQMVLAMGLRWLHLIGGILWFGLGFFMNFVHLAYMPILEPSARKTILLGLVPRILVFMMGGAVVSVVSGLLLGWVAPRHPEPPFDWLNFGIILGFVIFGVGVLIIVPLLLKVMKTLRNGQPPPPSILKTLSFFSKLNAYLGVPLIFAMLAGSGHFSGPLLPWAIGICATGWTLVWILFRTSVMVTTDV